MKAKNAFVLAGLFALVGLGLIIMSLMGGGELSKTQNGWQGRVTGLRNQVNDDEFPSEAYIDSQRAHARALVQENAVISGKLAAIRHRLTDDWFPTAPAGSGDPGRFNIAWKEARTQLKARFQSMTQELDWDSQKDCPVPPFSANPKKEEISTWQAKFWIFESLLEALGRHAHAQEDADSSYENRVVIRDCKIELNPDGKKKDRSYDVFKVTLKGLIPYSTLVAAISDLGSLPPDGDESAILFTPVSLDVRRSLTDPEKPTVEYYPFDAEPPSDDRPAAPLQSDVVIEWEVRRPQPYSPPATE